MKRRKCWRVHANLLKQITITTQSTPLPLSADVPAHQGIDSDPTVVPAVEPASTVVVAVAELVPVLEGIAVVDMAALAVKSASVVSVVAELEPGEFEKVDVNCLAGVAVDIAAAKRGSAALVAERNVGFDNKRKPRGQEPILAEAVKAQIEVPVAELGDIAGRRHCVAFAGSQVAGYTLCLEIVAGAEQVQSSVAAEGIPVSKDLALSGNIQAEVMILVAHTAARNLKNGLDMLELDQCRSSRHPMHVEVQLPGLGMDSTWVDACWQADCILELASCTSWRDDLQACDHNISQLRQVCCGGPKVCHACSSSRHTFAPILASAFQCFHIVPESAAPSILCQEVGVEAVLPALRTG